MLMATGFTDAIAVKSAKAVRAKADMVGIGLSGLCMVHCLIFPLLVSFAPAILRELPGDDVTHRVLAIGIALAGGLAFRSGYKVHRKGWILALFLLGIALISTPAALGEPVLSAYGETGITVCGSLLLITAHWCNRSFCHSCTVDSCHQEGSVTNDACNETDASAIPCGLTGQVVAAKMKNTSAVGHHYEHRDTLS
jgi:MerC mercury resistance protein